jgi:hypothetical protein
LFILAVTEQAHPLQPLLILQCHQLARDVQQAAVLLIPILIGILFVVILVVITHQFLAQALSQLLSQLFLQNKRVQMVVALFKADNNLLASTLLQFLVLRQFLYRVVVEMVTALLLPVQLANLLLAVVLGKV